MSPQPFKILYVEDDSTNRDLVSRILTRAGYIVLEAKDGLSGIQIAARERPDLILMDIMLPGMDGYQVTTRLKSLPELTDTPIVALTAKSMASDRDRALIAGCDGYIPKPIDIDYLRNQIAEFLGGKREEIEGGAEEKLMLQQEYAQNLVVQLEEKVRELQKANAQLRHADELKSKFIALASHELKTPLAVVQGYMMMLQECKIELAPQQDKMFHQSMSGIAKGVKRLKGIVEEMLDVIRIESQTIEVHREPMVVKEALMAATRRLESDAQERGVTIEINPMNGLPVVHADASRLQQVFFNLLSNAIKYTPDGAKISISATVTRGAKLIRRGYTVGSSVNFVEIVFADNGIGIDPLEQERIFELFYEVRDVRLHSTSKTRFGGGGLGLGLAIARGIVEAHGGFLWAESEGYDAERCPGSRFYVLLPLQH
jgi:signal transduction histidine kinase